jgi:hypothetical protein
MTNFKSMPISTRRMRRWRAAGQVCLAAACCCCALAERAVAQQGYGSYYGQNVVKSGGQVAKQSPANYLYDKYYHNRPSVSPYMNLDRIDPVGGTSYQSYVRPEQERRERTMQAQNAYIDSRKRAGNVGDTRFPGATYGGGGTAIMKPPAKRPSTSTSSAYYNHWYGGWSK